MWRNQGQSGKLTKRRQAELMQISEKTTDRMLSGDRVDRATVLLALKKLDLVWSDSLIANDEVAIGQQLEEESAQPVRISSRRKWLIVGLLAVTVPTIAITMNRFAYEPTLTEVARHEFFEIVARGTDQYNKGNYVAAMQTLNVAEERAQKENDVTGLSETSRMRGDVLLAQGNPRAALQCYFTALRLRRQTGQDVLLPPIQQAIGWAYYRLGGFEQATEALRQAIEGFLKRQDRAGVASAQKDLAEVCIATGDLEMALAWIASARSSPTGKMDQDFLTDLTALQALIEGLRGESKQAIEQLTECKDYWVRKDHRRWVARMDLRLGMVLAKAGLQDRAIKSFEQSENGFKIAGDIVGQLEARQLGLKLLRKK